MQEDVLLAVLVEVHQPDVFLIVGHMAETTSGGTKPVKYTNSQPLMDSMASLDL